ncbi:TPA: hypothetical protein ROA76_004367 [Escherichia coli]|nr:hypothetical protein [Escherichia coli]
MLHILDNDIYDILEFIAANNTPEQIEQAEEALPVKDEIQEQSFALLKQFAERRA